MTPKLSAAALDYFRAIGKRHGASGGRRAAANMTKAQRTARAVKASKAAALARAKRKRAARP